MGGVCTSKGKRNYTEALYSSSPYSPWGQGLTALILLAHILEQLNKCMADGGKQIFPIVGEFTEKQKNKAKMLVLMD